MNKEKLGTFTVRCHCGAMRGEVTCNLEEIICWDCNCSDCAMRRNLHFIVPRARFSLQCDLGAVASLYLWGTGVARRHFCKTCGVLPWYTPRSNPDGVGVTVGCVQWEGDKKPRILIKQYDGTRWEESHAATGIAAESEM